MTMTLHDSATVRAPGLLMCAGAGWRGRDVPVRFGLVARPNGRFVLVDTGYGPRVTQGSRSLPLKLYDAVLRPRLIEAASPRAVLAAAGAAPADVEAVVVTHFHADHVARLDEFPHAHILAHGGAARQVMAASPRQAMRHGVFKELLPADLLDRLVAVDELPALPTHPALGEGRDLFGDGSLLAVDLPGHADGHFGLFWTEGGRPTLYATDAAWSLAALLGDRTPAISRRVVFDAPDAGRRTEARLREFAAAGGRLLLCHDAAGDAR